MHLPKSTKAHLWGSHNIYMIFVTLYTILTNRYTQQKRNRRNSAEIDGFQTDL